LPKHIRQNLVFVTRTLVSANPSLFLPNINTAENKIRYRHRMDISTFHPVAGMLENPQMGDNFQISGPFRSDD
jgi:hypothetical protein